MLLIILSASRCFVLGTIFWVSLNLIIIDGWSLFTITDTEFNDFTGTIPSELGLLTGLNYLSFGKWMYIFDHLTAWKCSVLPTIFWVSLNLIIIDGSSLLTITDKEENDFTGTIPSKLMLLTGLNGLYLCKWKYVIDHFVCLKLFCVVNYILSIFESHYNWRMLPSHYYWYRW